MKKVNIVLSLIVLLAPLLLLKAKLEELNIEKHGKIAPMKIVQKPFSCVGTKVKWTMGIEHIGKVYFKQIGGNFCEQHNIGDIIEMKYMEGSDIILFPNESVSYQIFCIFILSFIGLLSFVYYGFLKKTI